MRRSFIQLCTLSLILSSAGAWAGDGTVSSGISNFFTNLRIVADSISKVARNAANGNSGTLSDSVGPSPTPAPVVDAMPAAVSAQVPVSQAPMPPTQAIQDSAQPAQQPTLFDLFNKPSVGQSLIRLDDKFPPNAIWALASVKKQGGGKENLFYFKIGPNLMIPPVFLPNGAGDYDIKLFYTDAPRVSDKPATFLAEHTVQNTDPSQMIGSVMSLPYRLPENAHWLQFKIEKDGDTRQVFESIQATGGEPIPPIYLPWGAGDYNISISYSESQFKLENVFSFLMGFSVHSQDTVDHTSLLPALEVQSNSPEIQALVAKIIAGKTSDLEKARALHDWEAENIRYDFDGLYTKVPMENGRMRSMTDNVSMDALTVLKNGYTICNGYANLYAALARAAGLPARVIEGKIVQNSEKPLQGTDAELCPSQYARTEIDPLHDHDWNEVQINGQWIPVDVTWDGYYMPAGKSGNSNQERVGAPGSERLEKYFSIDSSIFQSRRRVRCNAKDY